MVYTVASPNEYLAVTGAGIKTVKIVKATWVWPFQRVHPSVHFIASHVLTYYSANASAFNPATMP